MMKEKYSLYSLLRARACFERVVNNEEGGFGGNSAQLFPSSLMDQLRRGSRD